MCESRRWAHVLAAALVGLWAVELAQAAERAYKTRNVIIAVMDGVRYSETFGDPQRELIPNLAKMAREGTLYTNYYNTGVTITRQGHSTIATGTWQTVFNGGPRQTMPPLWEYARNELGWSIKDCHVIFGKGFYSYAAGSSFPTYGKAFEPTFAINIGEKNAADEERVLARVFQAMDTDKPRLIFVNFGLTDHVAHSNQWEPYAEAIRHCDLLFGKLWEKVQSTPGYQDATTVFFTNDHGRHNGKPDQLKGGFNGHGDKCEGCQHIMLLVLGPDTPRGAAVARRALEVDIAPTVGELLGFQTPLAEGSVLTDCLAECLGVNQKLAKTPEAERALALRKLAQRDLLRTLADATLKRTPAELNPSPKPEAMPAAPAKVNPLLAGVGVELLLRGMLRAAEVTQDTRYRDFVESWAKAYLKEAETNPHVARILVELAAKGQPADGLAAAKKCAERYAGKGPSPAPDFEELVDAPFRAGFVARVAQVTKDPKLAEAARPALGLEGKAEEQLVREWQKLGVRPAPMACELIQKPPQAGAATVADSARLLALLDAAAAAPEDRIIRLACDLQQSACSRGIREIGGVWDDPTVSAVNLYGVLAAARLRRARPIQWVAEPAQEKKGRRGSQLPLWAHPEQFYKGAFPYAFDLLKYKVDENGHYGDGAPMADGAALLLFAEAKGARAIPGVGPAQAALPPVPKGATRVIIEFGGGQKTAWKGTVAVEKGQLVALRPYLLEGNDQLDAAARSFVCNTMRGTDGLALDLEGPDETAVTIAGTPQGISFTLGDLKAKQTIEAKAPGNNAIRATIAK